MPRPTANDQQQSEVSGPSRKQLEYISDILKVGNSRKRRIILKYSSHFSGHPEYI